MMHFESCSVYSSDASKSVSPSGSQIGSPKPGAAPLPVSSGGTATTTSTSHAAVAGPRQQKPQANKQKPKKKKGGGGKW